jgi:hypothetical protein
MKPLIGVPHRNLLVRTIGPCLRHKAWPSQKSAELRRKISERGGGGTADAFVASCDPDGRLRFSTHYRIGEYEDYGQFTVPDNLSANP